MTTKGAEVSDMLRSSGNIAKILQGRHATEHSPPTRDGLASQSSESNVSAKDFLNKHQANISRLTQAFGLPGTEQTEPKKTPGSAKRNNDLDDLMSVPDSASRKDIAASDKKPKLEVLEGQIAEMPTLFDKNMQKTVTTIDHSEDARAKATSALEKRAS